MTSSNVITLQIGYFLKNLDQTNVNNAFLSGMKEDLQMYSNELVTSTSSQYFSSVVLNSSMPREIVMRETRDS